MYSKRRIYFEVFNGSQSSSPFDTSRLIYYFFFHFSPPRKLSSTPHTALPQRPLRKIIASPIEPIQHLSCLVENISISSSSLSPNTTNAKRRKIELLIGLKGTSHRILKFVLFSKRDGKKRRKEEREKRNLSRYIKKLNKTQATFSSLETEAPTTSRRMENASPLAVKSNLTRVK